MCKESCVRFLRSNGFCSQDRGFCPSSKFKLHSTFRGEISGGLVFTGSIDFRALGTQPTFVGHSDGKLSSLPHLPIQVQKALDKYKLLITCPFGERDFHFLEIKLKK